MPWFTKTQLRPASQCGVQEILQGVMEGVRLSCMRHTDGAILNLEDFSI